MRDWPAVTVIIVHRGSPVWLRGCLGAVRSLEYPADRVHVTVAEEKTTPAASSLLGHFHFPRALQIEVGVNNYCRANNLAVRRARTPYVALLNNDCRVRPDWLGRLVAMLELDPGLAGCMGKILLPDGRIYSAGHESLPEGHWRDLGMNLPDTPRFDLPGLRDSVTHAACLYRRMAYLGAGGMDEALVMYYDDVELGRRLSGAGWRLGYAPAAEAVHSRWSDTEQSWRSFLCHRSRLLYAARHHPDGFADWLSGSRLLASPGYHPSLYRVIPEAMARLGRLHGKPLVRRILPGVHNALRSRGLPAGFVTRILRRSRAASGLEKPALLIYDHALHFVGGGQRYAARLARELRTEVRLRYLTHLRPTRGVLRRTGFPGGIPLDILPLDPRLGGRLINPGRVRDLRQNPFEPVSLASASAPFFLNANMLVAVRPLSDRAIFLCHFPDEPRKSPFHVEKYDVLLCNSRYTRSWIRRRWGLRSNRIIHPPVDREGLRIPKTPILLSVARFDSSGSKKQAGMVEAFARLQAREPVARGWRLVLAGATVRGEDVLDRVRAALQEHPGLPVDLLPDLNTQALKRLYASAPVFWHLCGLGERDPHLVEHFGMTVVEAMQNGCVPVVFDGGGMRETVREGLDGFRVRSVDALVRRTARLLRDPALRKRMSERARASALRFGIPRFRREVRELFGPMLREYRDPAPPEVDAVRDGSCFKECLKVWERSSTP